MAEDGLAQSGHLAEVVAVKLLEVSHMLKNTVQVLLKYNIVRVG